MYRFLFGASGAGKSTSIQKEIIGRAQQSLQCGAFENYVFIVPEQYTMQTQKELVLSHPSGGILNIDVLSFGRLTHRIFEEAGGEEKTVLGDMGKCLLLRRIAGKHAGDLPVIGGNLHRTGYIAEVKSVLSEFMQYGIEPDRLDRLVEYSEQQGSLKARLKDLQKIYRLFLEYERENFVTSEETLDLVAEAIPHSAYAAGGHFVLDGFTGFTPVQDRVVVQLIKAAADVTICLPYSPDGGISPADVEKTGSAGSEEDLFYLTRKTVRDITALAQEQDIAHGTDLYMTGAGSGVPYRFAASPVLAHLERSLFRFPVEVCTAPPEEQRDSLRLLAASDPEEEVRQLCMEIRALLSEGCHYRDIAVVVGDPSAYEDEIARQAALSGIPVYFDFTHEVSDDPMTEAVRSALAILSEDWSYETVFRYLRSGLSDVPPEDTDILENYVRERGIHGRRRWELAFEVPCEELRLQVLRELQPLTAAQAAAGGRVQSAAERTRALYDFIAGNGFQAKMERRAALADEAGDTGKNFEYRQIYRAFVDLLDEIYRLLGEEHISAEDYAELIDTGISEIRLGALPQQTDVVPAGDLERSRLKEVRYLFVLGANEGSIPRSTLKGGLLSDLDREFLEGSGVELSPTPRQQMYIQRLYLYLNFTKPGRRLYISYADADADGHGQRPSYLVLLLQRMFPHCAPGGHVERPGNRRRILQVMSQSDAMPYLADALRRYADGYFDEAGAETGAEREKNDFLTLYGLCSSLPAVQRLKEAAFRRYVPVPLSKKTARLLYGESISGSVSRLEDCAECRMRQFLKYGLLLNERKTFELKPADTGSVLHRGLEEFSHALQENGTDWLHFSDSEAEKLSGELLERIAAEYGNQILYATARSSYRTTRMKRILTRTVMTQRDQLLQGAFRPADFELDFGTGEYGRPEGLVLPLTEGRTMSLTGRIDRLDLAEDGDSLYLKIIDYKSGSNDLKRDKILQGRQLQLIVYMEEALEWQRRLHPDKKIVPAALFYYHLEDPFVKAGDPGEAEESRVQALRPSGMLNADPRSLRLLDREAGIQGASKVAPVRFKKDGGTAASDKLFSTGEYTQAVSAVKQTMSAMGSEILDGVVTAQPFVSGKESACRYCAFRNVCGFDPRIPGYDGRSQQALH
ncbi:MAG: PD-(D/E)XK nuclease family protein [Lachnospiraceae bacterium]|jgi:ATP-dependent helicase/nuclease subunit B|nr:PD-(D/E)XK nuclease family protein [Lachnospiraceae bacterium]